MFLFIFLFYLLAGAVIWGIIGGLILKLAYRLALRHPLEFGDAFKVMFIAFLLSIGANIGMALLQLGDGPIPALISLAIYFAIIAWLLMTMEGLTLAQSLAVAGLMTVIGIIVYLLVIFVVLAAVIGSGAVS